MGRGGKQEGRQAAVFSCCALPCCDLLSTLALLPPHCRSPIAPTNCPCTAHVLPTTCYPTHALPLPMYCQVDAKHVELHLDEQKPEGVVNEALEQIAYADRVVLNKTDLVRSLWNPLSVWWDAKGGPAHRWRAGEEEWDCWRGVGDGGLWRARYGAEKLGGPECAHHILSVNICLLPPQHPRSHPFTRHLPSKSGRAC